MLCLPFRPVCIRLSVVHFLTMEEGGFVFMLSISPGGEGYNTPLQVIMWHVAWILTGICCGDNICAPLWPMMAGGLVFGEIFYQIMFSSHPIYQKFSFPESVHDPVKLYTNRYWTSLADVVIGKSVSCGAVRHCWSGWLGVAHLCECHARCDDSLTVYK